MGAQSSTGSLVRIFHALLRQNTWRQGVRLFCSAERSGVLTAGAGQG